MTRALFIVDVQNDFTERGALGVDGGDAVAERISRFLDGHADDYAVVVASRDWHHGDDDNGGHFSRRPRLRRHVARALCRRYLRGRVRRCLRHLPRHPSPEEGAGATGLLALRGGVRRRRDRRVDPRSARHPRHRHRRDRDGLLRAGLGLDAVAAQRRVRVLTDLIAGVHPESSAAALREVETQPARSSPRPRSERRRRPATRRGTRIGPRGPDHRSPRRPERPRQSTTSS